MLQIVFVLDDLALLNDVLEAWTTAGVKGITITESTGVHRVKSRASSHDAPLMLGLSRLLRTSRWATTHCSPSSKIWPPSNG